MASQPAESSNALQDDLARLEAALQQAEALAAIGALVPGMAHELHTPLGNAVTTASLLRDRSVELGHALDEGQLRRTMLASFVQDVHAGMDILQRSLQSALEIVAHLKQLSVDQASRRRREFQLDEVVRDVLCVLDRSVKLANCQVLAALHEDAGFDSHPGPLGQVLMNLIQNAVIHGKPRYIRISSRSIAAGLVELSIEDDGAGMSPEVRQRAFEPYFTTRAGQGGSGLGLHIVRSIVTDVLGGELSLSTAPGQGCRFSLRLPQQAPAQSAQET